MFEWLGVIGDLLGIGKNALQASSKRKQSRLDSELKVTEAVANAKVKRVNSNTDSDSEMDSESIRQQKNSWKDEFLLILFYMPIVCVVVTPFIICYKLNKWELLNEEMAKSWDSLNNLPDWYPYVLFGIFISVYGFRSFARKLLDSKLNIFKKK